MDANQRLKLQEMITENKVEDNTNLIRMFKHSSKIRDDITALAHLKRDYSRLSRERFEELCAKRCSFLQSHYTDMYNKIMRQEIDLAILDKVLVSLKKIEDSELDQHEASFEVGTLLKEMYVDSAMRRRRIREEKERREKAKDKTKACSRGNGAEKDKRCTSWAAYKQQYLD